MARQGDSLKEMTNSEGTDKYAEEKKKEGV